MKKFFLVLLTGLLLVGCNSNEPADDPTLLDENFDICSVMDDAEFKAYCLKKFDTDGDGKLSFIEGISITEIDVSGDFEKNIIGTIKSLKGIEYFSALTHLDCSQNQLSSLDISKNTALIKLLCYSNQLTELDVSNNTELTILNCDPMTDNLGQNVLQTLYMKTGQTINKLSKPSETNIVYISKKIFFYNL